MSNVPFAPSSLWRSLRGWGDALFAGTLRAALEPLVSLVCAEDDPAVQRATAEAAVRLVEAMDPRARALCLGAAMLARQGKPARFLSQLIVMAYYEQPGQRSRLGYQPDGYIADVAALRRERWAPDIAQHEKLLRSTDQPHAYRPGGAIRSGREMTEAALACDVAVVGSGSGGAVVAAELAEAGLSVIVLEEGGHHQTQDFTTSTLETLRTLYRGAGATTTMGLPRIEYVEGCCVGGSTVVNGGMAFRGSERVLERWSRSSGLPSLTAEELAPLYARVERFCSVAPQDPGTIGKDQELLRAGAEALGWRVIDNRRAQVHCGGCNVCVWGCPTGAKQSTLVSYLPRAVHFGANIWSDCKVETVIFEGKRAVGVRGVVAADGRRFEVRARCVVVSCGAIGTPTLLQRSGVRAPSHQLGRNLALHPGAAVTAVYGQPIDGWKGAHQAVQVREFENDGTIMAAVNMPPSFTARSLWLSGGQLRREMDAYRRMLTAGVLIEDTHTGRVRDVAGTPVATYRVTDGDAARIVLGVARLSEALLAAGALHVHPPIRGHPPLTTLESARDLQLRRVRPADLELSTVHLMGTARLGADPMSSVCDQWGAVRDRADLYVADSSLFPGPLGVNPMLTIMALATRVGQGIVARW